MLLLTIFFARHRTLRLRAPKLEVRAVRDCEDVVDAAEEELGGGPAPGLDAGAQVGAEALELERVGGGEGAHSSAGYDFEAS